MSGTRRRRLLLWAALLALALGVLHGIGAGTLGVPLASAADLSTWVDRTPPDVMALALLRLAALACGWYLAVCTLVVALAQPLARPRLAALVARLSPALVRRLASGGGGLGLAAGTLLASVPSTTIATATVAAAPASAATSSAAPPGTGPTAPTATMARVDPGTPGSGGPGAEAATATMTRLPGEDAARPSTPEPPSHSPPPLDPPADEAPARWIVEPGDSFWSIAAAAVAEPGVGRAPDRVVAGYWRRLIEANRDRLLDPGNPDLLVPGQELVLPPPG